MIVIPKERPIVGNLNSYYVQIDRLIEHFQGELGCGGLYFKSLSSEGILFFDKDEILNGIFSQKKEETTGPNIVDLLIDSSEKTNYLLSVYLLRTEDIYLWSSTPEAKKVYQDLTTEFTDLEGLIKKMRTEELTGFIEVAIESDKGGGLVFLSNGQVSGGSYSWGSGDSLRGPEDQQTLIGLTKKHGGSFNVNRIPMDLSGLIKDASLELGAQEIDDKPSKRIITAMGEMIAIFERTVRSLKNVDTDFATLLNRKFVEKADKYPFLDPFAAEFKYQNEKISIDGDTNDSELTQGVLESISELATELNAKNKFRNNLLTWMKKYKEEINNFDMQL
jgi:hypothetical protein